MKLIESMLKVKLMVVFSMSLVPLVNGQVPKMGDTSVFQGVDNEGKVFLEVPINWIEIAESVDLPMIARFSSESSYRSPYLGPGWEMTILDSRVQLLDENTAKLVTFDGDEILLSRASEGRFIDSAGQELLIDGSRAEFYMKSGSVLHFWKGRISKIKIGNTIVDIKHANGVVQSIHTDNRRVLMLEYNESLGGRKIILNGKASQVEIFLESVPRMLSGADAASPVLSAVPTITELRENGEVTNFEYGFERSESSLRIVNLGDANASGDINARWDTLSGNVIAFNEDVFRVEENDDESVKVRQMDFTGSDNDIISFERNLKEGSWTYEYGDGTEKALFYYPNGPLRGLLRQVMHTDASGDCVFRFKPQYDTTGSVLGLFVEEGPAKSFIDVGENNPPNSLKKQVIINHK